MTRDEILTALTDMDELEAVGVIADAFETLVSKADDGDCRALETVPFAEVAVGKAVSVFDALDVARARLKAWRDDPENPDNRRAAREHADYYRLVNMERRGMGEVL